MAVADYNITMMNDSILDDYREYTYSVQQNKTLPPLLLLQRALCSEWTDALQPIASHSLVHTGRIIEAERLVYDGIDGVQEEKRGRGELD